jgi:periplasmic copper chaperone A
MRIIATRAKRSRRCSLFRALGSSLLLALLATPAHAGDIDIKQAWSRATPKGAQVAGGYLTIENNGITADRLVSATSPAAAKVEIHEMTTLNGIMVMRPVEDGLAIPPEGRTALAPGSNHLMFTGISAPFHEGQRIAATLTFEKAGTIDVTFDVGSVGAKGPQLVIASTGPVVAAASPPLSSPDDFFTHLCGTRAMANVTLSPIRSGHVAVSIELENADELPLAAASLTVTRSNPDARIAAVTAAAERTANDKWRVSVPAAVTGKWLLALAINITADDRVDIAAPVLIER